MTVIQVCRRIPPFCELRASARILHQKVFFRQLQAGSLCYIFTIWKRVLQLKASVFDPRASVAPKNHF